MDDAAYEITFQLVRGMQWTSRIIGWFGDGYYSHIDVVTPRGHLRGSRSDWIKGIHPGYYDRPQHYERWDRVTRYTIKVTQAQYQAYWYFSDSQIGKPYDSRGLFSSFVLGREWRDDSAWWCSEEVAWNLEKALIVKLPDEMRNVEPGDCAFIFIGLQAKIEELGR